VAERTFNQELFDAMLRHQTGLLRFSGGMRNRIWALLDATETDVKRKIRRGIDGGAGLSSKARVQKLETLLASLKKTRLRAWKDVDDVWFSEIRELSVAEAGFFDRIITASFPGVELGTVLPDTGDLRQIVTSQPFLGRTLRQWSDKVQVDDIARIEDQIKIGLVQGESGQQISRRVVGTVAQRGRDGTTQITRRQAATITRTVVSGVAAESRKAYALANVDILPNELFTATLDARTTPICRRFDGKVFKVAEGPQLPLHFNERSVYSPVADGGAIGERPRRDFTQRQLLREFAKEEGFRAPVKRANLPRGTKRNFDAFARKRMRELTGRAPARTSYQTWLTGQPAAFQNDILGPTRGALFRRGGLTLDKYVTFDGTELTLAQLATRHTDAFLRAGLDPDLFR